MTRDYAGACGVARETHDVGVSGVKGLGLVGTKETEFHTARGKGVNYFDCGFL